MKLKYENCICMIVYSVYQEKKRLEIRTYPKISHLKVKHNVVVSYALLSLTAEEEDQKPKLQQCPTLGL